METKQDQEFVEYIVKAIVNHPEDVKVERMVDEMGVLISVKVNREDMGVLIGRQGSTARAIRTLLRVIGTKSRARINFKIEEPEGGSDNNSESNTAEAKKDVDNAVDNLDI
ncbi:MAG TPA: KH domain-containing protein [Candidatus Portnoybacteria bacterium]|nr:KH domain-containing protein [Candidatus Portnoybacteria bacterium]